MGFFGKFFGAVKRVLKKAYTETKKMFSSVSNKFEKFTLKAARTLERTAVDIYKTLRVIRSHLTNAISNVLDWITAHPYRSFLTSTAILAMATPMFLGWAGFTAVGPLAGSIAASLQPATVAAGSFFATLQSAAMGGYGVATLTWFWVGLAAVGMVMIALWGYFFGNGHDGPDDKGPKQD